MDGQSRGGTDRPDAGSGTFHPAGAGGLQTAGKESTREISAATRPDNMIDHHNVAASGGGVARNARIEIEKKTGRKVISPFNATDAGALDVDTGDMLPPPTK